jgi:hypothetical protein
MFVKPEAIPQVARPGRVARSVDEATKLRARLAEAREAGRQAAGALERAEADDVEAQAAAARAGEPVSKASATVAKARSAADAARREVVIIERAVEMADTQLVDVIEQESAQWTTALDREQEQARERGVRALADFAQALADLRAAAAAHVWLQSALGDQRFDRPLPTPVLGARAPSSARQSINGEPFGAELVVGWARELVEPPPIPEPPRPVFAPNAATG